MANVYLSVPHYVSSYFRCRDEFHIIAPSQPVCIDTSEIHLWPYLSNYLINNADGRIYNNGCFNQRQWRRMLAGQYLHKYHSAARRNMKGIDHLSDEDVHDMAGFTDSNFDENTEYLCLQIPREVLKYPLLHRTDENWTLSIEGVRKLRKALTDEFWIAFFDYMRRNTHYTFICNIKRATSENMIRFMNRYQIRSSADGSEYAALKRNYNRKLKPYRLPEDIHYAQGITD